MDLESVNNIPIVDNELYLIADTIEFNSNEIYFTSLVTEFGHGRLDQFALRYLGDSNREDILGEFNEMEDLTDIREGDLIYIPYDGRWKFITPSTNNNEDIKNSINEKISKKLPNRKKRQTFIKEKGRLTF